MPKEIFSHVGLACCSTRDGSDRPATYRSRAIFQSNFYFYEAMIYKPTSESGQKGFVYAARHNFWLALPTYATLFWEHNADWILGQHNFLFERPLYYLISRFFTTLRFTDSRNIKTVVISSGLLHKYRFSLVMNQNLLWRQPAWTHTDNHYYEIVKNNDHGGPFRENGLSEKTPKYYCDSVKVS